MELQTTCRYPFMEEEKGKAISCYQRLLHSHFLSYLTLLGMTIKQKPLSAPDTKGISRTFCFWGLLHLLIFINLEIKTEFLIYYLFEIIIKFYYF